MKILVGMFDSLGTNKKVVHFLLTPNNFKQHHIETEWSEIFFYFHKKTFLLAVLSLRTHVLFFGKVYK